ncbi:GNAT family N-acetyltransferase [Clostridium sp. YIM B02515]|uniref:GNAT family N-acetyltransferase n=1 Tax=Clostridium rhizosphaerae TaxID=2803861 RepID=A0ABS1T829_9CLOT|nr:GNAT family N-acetyltransferase [Clostridium rhizosphaerae]MBL4934148.1 GNAT family N-acetyltransferase [Clostridium rhizosphaerae]
MIRLLVQADKEIIMEYLDRNEIETSFLYANVVEFGVDNRKDIRRCADYYGFFKNDILKGILPFYNLGSCIPHYEDVEAVPLFADIMKEKNFEFLIGMQKVVKPLYELIKDYKEIQAYNESSYFINNNFKLFILDEVNFIEADKVVTEKVVDFVMDAKVYGFKQNTTKEDIKKTLSQRGEEEEFIIAEKNGIMVSQACVQTYTPKINQIGSVYTPESERGKGYCKAVVSELCRRIIDKGKVPTLSVRKNNTPAVKAYTALGFEHYDDYLLIRVK